MAEDQPSLLQKFVQDELPQELRDLVSNLPMENGWAEKHLYQYQGFWYNPFILQALVTLQKHFHANDNDIFLVSIPKSGTTWLKALAFSIVNRRITDNFSLEDAFEMFCKGVSPGGPFWDHMLGYWNEGWLANHLHQYQGFWYFTRQLQGVLSCQKHFNNSLNSDILIVTTPKSGTTWLKAWTFALLNRHKYPKMFENHPLLTKNPHFLVPFLELDLYNDKDLVPDLNSIPSPRLFSTHLPYVSLPKSVIDSNCKILYLCRNPKDTFISLWHFTNKLKLDGTSTNSLEDSFKKFCNGVSICGPFWEHVLGYWKESLDQPKKIMLMRYEEMKKNPSFVLKELARFVGCPFSKEEEDEGVIDDILKLCSFKILSNLEVNKKGKLSSGEEHRAFFRLGEVGDSNNYLTAEMIEQLDIITEKKLGHYGFRF
ncbi:hypothetical protein HN51_000697 [Arachis hypogaea]